MASTLVALAGGAAAWVAALFNGQQPFMSMGDVNSTLAPLLSPGAAAWLPGTEGFTVATERWSPRINPEFDIVVDVATAEDVSHTVRLSPARCVTRM